MFFSKSGFRGLVQALPGRLLLVALVLLFPSSVRAAEERESVGYVFDSVGDWVQDGKKIARKSGDAVYAGAVIVLDPAYRTANPERGAMIVKLFDGKREERSAEKPGDLDRPISLPAALGEKTSRRQRFMRAMGGLFSGHAEKYLITTVRGADLLRLHEAVVKFEEGAVDLAPVFQVAPPGKYLVRFRPVEDGGTVKNPVAEPVAYEWQPGKTKPLAVPGLEPGLWRISLLHPDDERPLGVDAWTLVSAAEAFAPRTGAFREVAEVAAAWGEKVSAAEVRSFLRTALDALAQQPQP